MLSTMRDLWWLTQSCRKMVFTLLVAALAQQGLRMVSPLVLGHIVNLATTQDPAALLEQADWWVIIFVSPLIMAYLIQLFVRRGELHLVYRVKGALIRDAFQHLLSLPVSYHESRETGRKTKVIQNGTGNAVTLADSWASSGMPVVFFYLLCTPMLLSYWWPAGLIVGMAAPTTVVVSVFFYQMGKRFREERHDWFEASEALLLEGLQNVATVQSFRMEQSHVQQIDDIWQRVYTLGFQELRFSDYGYILRNTLIVGSSGCVLWLGLRAVSQGHLSVGILIAVLFLSIRMMDLLWPLGQLIDNTINQGPSLRRLREVFLIQSEVQESPVAIPLETCQGSLELRNVSFRYAGKETDALQNFSLTIKRGSVVALVGPSGAGKSTLFKLLRRFADPSTGGIFLDGHDLRHLKLDFRRHIAVVSQEIEVFSGTIADNIAFGREDMSLEEIQRVAAMAHLNEFVRTLPDGYNTLIGERGMQLSGGQRQRLAIARALAIKASIILFDEATSHLDLESEAAIQEALKTIAGICTLIIIAHRLPTIRHADHIAVIDGGRLVEQGTHQTLSQLNDGVYRKYLLIQSA